MLGPRVRAVHITPLPEIRMRPIAHVEAVAIHPSTVMVCDVLRHDPWSTWSIWAG